MRSKGEGSVYLRGKIWWIRFLVDGKPVQESSKSTDKQVSLNLLRKRLGKVADSNFVPSIEKTKIAELCDDVVEDYKDNGFDTVDKAERSSARIKSFFGDLKAQETLIVQQAVKKYKTSRREEGAKPATINRELAFLKRAYSLGVENGKVTNKPVIKMLEEKNVRTGFFSYEEFVRLRDVSPDWYKNVLTFAYYIPWRVGNIVGLTWDKIDATNWVIRVEGDETKNEEANEIPLTGEVLSVVQGQYENRTVQNPDCSTSIIPWVFHRDGKQIPIDCRPTWYAACIAAGLGKMVEIERNGKKVEKYEGRVFHDFRRTGVREFVRAGNPEKLVMSISGHKTRSVFDRYNIVNNEDRKLAAERHARHIEEQRAKAQKKVVPLRKPE